MTVDPSSQSGDHSGDQSIANLLEKIARDVDAGKEVEIESVAAEYPEYADRLRELAPAMQALAGWAERTASFASDEQGNLTQHSKAYPEVGEFVRYFGDYEILEEIARGGMGVVYKARQLTLDRIVALKMVLSGELASSQELDRFRAEAQAAANLDHPGIVPIFEVGEHNGRHYFSMGYVEGDSLADRVKDGPLDPQQSAEIMGKVSTAINYAHQQGVIHRDLKPGNVLLDSRDEPRVTDFGLAKQVESNSDLTNTGQVLGTPAYMPPEQAGGDLDKIDARSDVYSLGATLYCLLTGRPPFQAANPVDTLMQVLGVEPASPRKLNPAVPADLDTISLKCLEKEPDRRYQTAQEVVDELDRYLRKEPILARPIGRAARTWRWCKRRPAVAALIALIVGLVGFLSIAGPAMAVRESNLRATAEQQRVRAEENEEKAEQARSLADEQRRKAEALAEENHGQLVQMNVLQGDELLKYEDPAGALPWYGAALSLELGDDRREAPHQLRLASVWRNLPKFTQFWRHEGNVTHIALSKDGNRVATSSSDKTVQVTDLTTGESVVPPLKHEYSVWCSDFSPDGTMLATASGSLGVNGEVRLWDMKTGDPIHGLTKHFPKTVFFVAFTDSGKLLTVDVPISGEGKARIWDPDSFEEIQSCAIAPADYVYHSVGQLVDRSHGRVYDRMYTDRGRIVDLENDGKVLCELPHEGWVQAVCFSQDGSLVMTAEWNAIHVWEVKTGNKIASCSGFHSGWSNGYQPTLAASFTLDNKRVTLAGDKGQVLQFLIDTEELVHLRTVRGVRSSRPVISDDGRFVAQLAQDQAAHIWNVRSEKMSTVPFRHSSSIGTARFAADTRRLITACSDGSVRVWDPATIFRPYRIHFPNAYAKSIALSDDGKEVVIGNEKGISRYSADGRNRLGSAFELDDTTIQYDVSVEHQLVAQGTSKGTSQVFNYATGDAVSPKISHSKKYIRGVRISPDGSYLGTIEVDTMGGPAAYLGIGNVYRVETGERVVGPLSFPGVMSAVIEIEFSPDSQQVSIVGGNVALKGIQPQIRILNLQTGKDTEHEIPHSSEQGVGQVVFDPTGRYLASAAEAPHVRDGGELCVWDMEEKRVVMKPVSFSLNVQGLTIDSQSRFLAAFSGNLVHLFHLQNGVPAIPALVHDQLVDRIEFSDDGKHLLTATQDGMVRVWNVDTGQLMTSPRKHPRPITALRMTSDGYLLTASKDHLVRFWPYGSLNRSREELRRMTRLLSGATISDSKIRQSSTVEQLESDWAFLSSKYPEDFRAKLVGVSRWHDEQVSECWAQRDWHSAVTHFIGTGGLSRHGHNNFGNVLCEIGKHEAAIPEFDAAIAMASEESAYWMLGAFARLHANGQESFEEYSHKMLDHFVETEDPWAASRVITTYFFLPGDLIDKPRMEKLIQLAKQKNLGPRESGRIQLALAMAHFRRDQFEPARRLLQEMIEEADDSFQVSLSKYLIAMTLQGLDQSEAASEYYLQAKAYHDEYPIDSYAGSWFARTLIELMRSEAADLIGLSSAIPDLAEKDPRPREPSTGELAALLRRSALGVEEAVELALRTEPSVLPELIGQLLLGEALILAEEPERAAEIIRHSIDIGATEHWYPKSLGWALAAAGDSDKAAAAFRQGLSNVGEFDSKSKEFDPDHWVCAYFLDLVTAEEFAERWRNDENHGEKYACFAWFYIGQRYEIEGQKDEAIEAYEKSVELGKLPNAFHIHFWSSYRLQRLQNE